MYGWKLNIFKYEIFRCSGEQMNGIQCTVDYLEELRGRGTLLCVIIYKIEILTTSYFKIWNCGGA